MKLKPVPEPPDSLAFVADAQRAVPLVPGSETDCCARLLQRTPLERREDARTWLTFLRALGLVEETESGFVRTDRDPERATLAAAFRERVYGVDSLLAALAAADDPVDADELGERLAADATAWERGKAADWRVEWRERVDRLLGWAVLLGLAERVDGNYRAV